MYQLQHITKSTLQQSEKPNKQSKLSFFRNRSGTLISLPLQELPIGLSVFSQGEGSPQGVLSISRGVSGRRFRWRLFFLGGPLGVATM